MLCNLVIKSPGPAIALNICKLCVYIVTRDDKVCSLNFVIELLLNRFQDVITIEHTESSSNRSCIKVS